VASDKSVDALKGLAIVLVVAGHVIPWAAAVYHGGPGLVKVEPLDPFGIPLTTATNLLFSLIGSFHMPLFAFASGLVMWPPRESPLFAQIGRRARGLLLPYLSWFVLGYFTPRANGPATLEGFVPALTAVVLGQAGLWFLYALFLCATMLIVLLKVTRSQWALAASASVAIAWSTGLLFPIPTVLWLSKTLWIYPFVVLGYIVSASWKERVGAHRLLVGLGALAAFLPLFYLRHPVHVAELQQIGRVAVALYDAGVRGGFVLSLAVPYLCAAAAIIALYALYTGGAGRLTDAQAWLGRRSLGIYAIHGGLLWWLIGAGVRNPWLLMIAGLVVPAALTVVIERIPVLSTLLLGRELRRAPRPVGPSEEPTAR